MDSSAGCVPGGKIRVRSFFMRKWSCLGCKEEGLESELNCYTFNEIEVSSRDVLEFWGSG